MFGNSMDEKPMRLPYWMCHFANPFKHLTLALLELHHKVKFPLLAAAHDAYKISLRQEGVEGERGKKIA